MTDYILFDGTVKLNNHTFYPTVQLESNFTFTFQEATNSTIGAISLCQQYS